MLSKNQLKLVRSLELKKNRKKEGLFVAEGPKIVGDLLRAGYRARTIFCTEQAELHKRDGSLCVLLSRPSSSQS